MGSRSVSITNAQTRTNNTSLQGVTAPVVSGSGRDSTLFNSGVDDANTFALDGSHNNKFITGDFQEAPKLDLVGDGNIINFTLPDFFRKKEPAQDYNAGSIQGEQTAQLSASLDEYGGDQEEAESEEEAEEKGKNILIAAAVGAAALWGAFA